MPYSSDRQRRWAHTKTGTAKLGAAAVREFDSASKGKELPESASQRMASSRSRMTPRPSHKHFSETMMDEGRSARIARLKGKLAAFKALQDRKTAKETYRTRGA